MNNYNRPDHNLTILEKRFVLDRDGWCCNNCGYVPFHTTKDVPFWARGSYLSLHTFFNDLKMVQPFVCIEYKTFDGKDEFGNILCDVSWLHGGELHFDHIIPLCNNGPQTIDNIQVLCANCHKIKSGLEYRYTEATKYILSKFNPVRIGVAI